MRFAFTLYRKCVIIISKFKLTRIARYRKDGNLYEITKSGFQATKLASTGGFLMSGNTTFLICSEDDKIDEIIEIIKDHSHKRKQFVPSAASYGVGSYTSFPVEVFVGGATIFVTNIERFEKV